MIRTKFYHAYYEDVGRVESWFDFVDASMAKYRQPLFFGTVQEAEHILMEAIKNGRTCFGTGTILYMEPAKKHCKNCTCGGVWAMREYSVDASGIVEENELEPPCEEDEA
jgi:hypothetical protein